ncbi:MAG: hypothetical protein A4E38_00294 [Methanoregulaceae archaeon PtaB.Bin108]|nr:MAG: hypothetical protein A4E38_00294 [Methanoregulaceae archaeon PtaB.Bin108]
MGGMVCSAREYPSAAVTTPTCEGDADTVKTNRKEMQMRIMESFMKRWIVLISDKGFYFEMGCP